MGASAYAATNNCPHVTGTQTVNGAVITTPGPSGGSPDNTLTATNNINGIGNGCTSIDQTFRNISGTGAFFSNTGTYLFETPTSSAYDPLVFATSLTFASVRGTSGGTADTTNDFTQTGTGSAKSGSSDLFLTDAVAGGNGIYRMSLGVLAASVSGAGGAGVVTVSVCSGSSLTATFSTSAACTGAGGTGFQQLTLNLANTTALQALAVSFATPVTNLAINVNLNLTGGGGFLTSSIGSLSLDFAEAPEPATFGLMGSALAGLAFAANRRRRK